jgi:hypothetical protein
VHQTSLRSRSLVSVSCVRESTYNLYNCLAALARVEEAVERVGGGQYRTLEVSRVGRWILDAAAVGRRGRLLRGQRAIGVVAAPGGSGVRPGERPRVPRVLRL